MPNIKISALPDVTLPLDAANVFLEVQSFEAGEEVSRKIAAQDLQSAFGLDATFVTVTANAILPNERILTAGSNISIIDGGAGNPITISVTGLALASLSDVDLTGQATGDLLFNVDGVNWEDTAGDLRIDIGQFELQSNYSYVANAGMFFRNANGDVFLDNVLLGGGLFQYTVAVGGNDGIRIRDNGLALFGMSGGTQRTTLQSGEEVDIIRNGVDQVVLTLAPAAGGLSVNNTLTGAGLERVLTVGDLGGGSPNIDTFNYQFDTDLDAFNDPGAGFIRFNNATPSVSTIMAISTTDADGNDLDPDVTRWGISEIITIRDPADSTRFVRYVRNAGAIIDGGTWFRFPVLHITGDTYPTDNADITTQLRAVPQLDGGNVLTGTILVWNQTDGRYEAIDNNWRLTTSGGTSQLGTNQNLRLQSSFRVEIAQPFYFLEQAAAVTDFPGFGQFWVRDDVPNTPMFTDDTGVDSVLNAAVVIPDPLIIGSINLTSAELVSTTGTPYDNVPINIGANLVGTQGMTQFARQNIQTKPSAFGFNSTLFININGAGTAGSNTIIGGLNGAQVEVDFGVAVRFQHAQSGTTVAETAAASAGGFLANNQATGAGLERVLTTADLGGGVGISGTPVNNQIAIWVSATDIEGDAAVTFNGVAFIVDGEVHVDIDPGSGGLGLFMQNGGAGTEIFGITATGAGGIDLDFTNVTVVNFNNGDVYDFSDDIIRNVSGLFLRERAAAQGDIAAQGQIWVEDDSPNRLKFTNDNGNDFTLALAGGVSGVNVNQNSSFNFNSAGNLADNYIGLHNDGGNDTITLGNSTGLGLTNFPIFSSIQMICPGSGVITVTEGTGTTLFLDDGTDTVGGVTVSQGVVTIFRSSATAYIIFGSGIT